MDKALLKVLECYPKLQLCWQPKRTVWQAMQHIPPVYIFDIRPFAEQPFHTKNHNQQQYQTNMEVRETIIPEGIHLMCASVQSKSDGYIHIDVKHPYIQLFFALNNNRSYYHDTTLLDALSPGKHQGFVFQATKIIGLWNARTNDRFIEINVAVPLFLKWCSKSPYLLQRIESLLASGHSGTLFTKSQITTPQQHNILQSLQHPIVLGDEWQDLYIRGKIMELMASIFDQATPSQRDKDPETNIPMEMIVLMDKAQGILDKELSNPPSIQALSSLLGTNENYLKKYFKLRHHMTIRNYIITTRLQAAKKLLHEGEKPIKEISHFLGYDSPAHFSASFKKHYGLPPKHLRNR